MKHATAERSELSRVPGADLPTDGSHRLQQASRTMRQTSEDNYVADSGYRMQREYGLTPKGHSISGRWVLRAPDATWIDCDHYRHQLLARHGFGLE